MPNFAGHADELIAVHPSERVMLCHTTLFEGDTQKDFIILPAISIDTPVGEAARFDLEAGWGKLYIMPYQTWLRRIAIVCQRAKARRDYPELEPRSIQENLDYSCACLRGFIQDAILCRI